MVGYESSVRDIGFSLLWIAIAVGAAYKTGSNARSAEADSKNPRAKTA